MHIHLRTHASVCVCVYIYIYIYIYIYVYTQTYTHYTIYHHHAVPLTQISLTLSYHLSLLSIAPAVFEGFLGFYNITKLHKRSWIFKKFISISVLKT